MYSGIFNTNYSRKSIFVFQLLGVFSILSCIILVSCKENVVTPTSAIDYSVPTTQIYFNGNLYSGFGYNSSNSTFTGNAGIINSLTITGAPVSGNASILDYVSNATCSGCSFIIFKINNASYYSQSGTVSTSGNAITLDVKMYQLYNTTLTSSLKGMIYY